MTVNEILAVVDSYESVEIYDTTESNPMRTLCAGAACNLDLDTDIRGFIGDEEVVCLWGASEADGLLVIGIGNPSGK